MSDKQRFAARAAGRGAGRGTRLASVVAVGLTAVLLTGCEGKDSGAAAPEKVAGEAVPAPGDSAPGKAPGKQSPTPSESSGSREGGTEKGEKPPARSESGGSGSSGTDDPPTAEEPGGGGSCQTPQLSFTTSGMAEGTLRVNLTNTGSAGCDLQGFPGVDLRTSAGDSINAARSGLGAPTVSLKPGGQTSFTLHYPPNDTGGSGVSITGLTVTPPNETRSKNLPVSISLPVTEGPGPGVTVDPIGAG